MRRRISSVGRKVENPPFQNMANPLNNITPFEIRFSYYLKHIIELINNYNTTLPKFHAFPNFYRVPGAGITAPYSNSRKLLLQF